MGFGSAQPPFLLQFEWLQNSVGQTEAETWTFEVPHHGYLPLEVDRPVLKQVASGKSSRAIGIFYTEFMYMVVSQILYEIFLNGRLLYNFRNIYKAADTIFYR